MQFVYGKPHPLVEPDWYLRIGEDKASRSFAIERSSAGTAKFAFQGLQGHLPDPILADIRARAMLSLTNTCMIDRIGWYMNRVGGMCAKLHDITQETKADDFPLCFVQDDIRIIQWPGGDHYYAKIGDEDVVWENKQKWNSRSEAMKAAKRFLKKKKVNANV